MIQTIELSSEEKVFTSSEYEEYMKEYAKTVANSWDDYREKGHEWCWGLVGNYTNLRLSILCVPQNTIGGMIPIKPEKKL